MRLGVGTKPARDDLHSLWLLRTEFAAGPTRAAYSKRRGVVPVSIHTCCKPSFDRCLQIGLRLTELSRRANYELGPAMQAFHVFYCIRFFRGICGRGNVSGRRWPRMVTQ